MNSLQADGFPEYTDLTKAWVNFEFPFLLMSALREAHRKNAAALTSASQLNLCSLAVSAVLHGAA